MRELTTREIDFVSGGDGAQVPPSSIRIEGGDLIVVCPPGSHPYTEVVRQSTTGETEVIAIECHSNG